MLVRYTALLFYQKGSDICTESQKHRGRPKRNMLENTVSRLCIRLKLEDARNMNKIISSTGIQSKSEIVKNALKMYAESLGNGDIF